jgi:hypothetical protein
MRAPGRIAGLFLFLTGVAACGGPTPPEDPIPSSISLSAAAATFNALGATLQIVVTVRDQDNEPIPGLTATYATGNAAVATVSPGGLVTAVGNGSTNITVSHGTLSAQLPVTVAQVVTQLAKVGGDQQTGLVSDELPAPVQVEQRDARSNPVPGTFVSATVVFAAGQGGSVGSASVPVGADGRASTTWTLGSSGGTQQLTATVQGGTASAQFTANAVTAGAYDLELRFLSGTNPNTPQQAAFDAAEALWESIIVGDLAPVAVNIPANACVQGQPALNEIIDDMVVFVEFASIDGPGGTLAQAGRCDIQPPNPPFRGATDSLPVIGVLRIDSGDLTGLQSSGTLDETIIHELGHTLGFSSDFFALKGRLQDPSLPSSPGVDTHFDGATAIARMDAVGGASYSDQKVPLDNTAVVGSADSHWRESVFDAELMTPIIETASAMPLSSVTGGAMQDLGYVVNLAATQTFSLSLAALAATEQRPGVRLENDVIFRPLPPSAAGRR